MRKKYTKLPHHESQKRNLLMLKKFDKLVNKGYGKMKIYQLLADEHDIEERNSVAGIIRNLKKETTTK